METVGEESKPGWPDQEHSTILRKIWRIDSMLRILKHYADWQFRASSNEEKIAVDIQNQVDAIRGVLLSLEQHFDSCARLDEDEDKDEPATVEEAPAPDPA